MRELAEFPRNLSGPEHSIRNAAEGGCCLLPNTHCYNSSTGTKKSHPVHTEDTRQYTEFIDAQIEDLQVLKFDPDTVLWHYTTGDSLLNIIESGLLYATQVSCLNDSTEVRYSGGALLAAIERVRKDADLETTVRSFLDRMTAALIDHPDAPSHAPSPYFVSCFSEKSDDLSQWRAYSGGENGYAIGFRARGLFGAPNSVVVRVNYDKEKHFRIADRITEATVRFFKAGLELKRAESAEKWADEFLLEWGRRIGHLGPMVKDEGFSGEKEYRLIHELQMREMGSVRFRQKKTLLSRYLPLSHPQVAASRSPLLPIAEVKIGPSRHKELSAVSVRTLLRQLGYGSLAPVTLSEIPFQET